MVKVKVLCVKLLYTADSSKLKWLNYLQKVSSEKNKTKKVKITKLNL